MEKLLNIKTNKNKIVLMMCLIVVLILVIIISTLLVKSIFFSYKEGPLTFEKVEIRVFEEFKLSDIIKNKEIKIIDDQEIKTDKIGFQNIEFKYTYEEKKYLGEVSVNIIDDISPTIFASSSYTIVKGKKKDFLNDIICGDNYDDNPIREIIGEYDLNKVGEYNLSYYAKDSSGNESTQKFKVKVVEKISSKTTTSKKVLFSDILKTYKTENTEVGIDVSKWQGDIDFEKVKESGCEFVMMRLGYQKGLGGEMVLDPYYKENIRKATAANLKVGVYVYTYAKDEKEAVSQAKWVIDNIGSYDLELGISYDWESWTSFNKLNLSFHRFNKVAHIFLDYVEQNGYKSMLYSSKYYLENIWSKTNHDVWLAHYTSKTNYEGNYRMWQMTSSGKINGIVGDVDIDILYKD